ncbi:MAG: SDR family NAD(P)-dependent oxidoreductase [Alphaproteobacteria bacterium]|nr:SDR family NAD(P)-dependent oxidoreductase [Alphaproteobacteria bacterium]
MSALEPFGTGLSVAVFGASGGIGRALTDILQSDISVERVYALSRTEPEGLGEKSTGIAFDMLDEASIAEAATVIAKAGPLHLAIIATGFLHDDTVGPEKRSQDLNSKNMEHLFRINTIGPALIAKHVFPLLAKDRRSVFAALSARVGSISDNKLGGWHCYRASKAALNMVIRTLSIEMAYRNQHSICVALHPGTVDTQLSEPFRGNLPAEKVFTPVDAATQLLEVMAGLSPKDTGGFFAWDGQKIPY